jgi:hypothetical protein
LLAVYERAGFVGEQADRAVGAVFVFVLGNAIGPAATVALNRGCAATGATQRNCWARRWHGPTRSPGGFPAARLASPTADFNATADGGFEFGLAALLDGLQARPASPGTPDRSFSVAGAERRSPRSDG